MASRSWYEQQGLLGHTQEAVQLQPFELEPFEPAYRELPVFTNEPTSFKSLRQSPSGVWWRTRRLLAALRFRTTGSKTREFGLPHRRSSESSAKTRNCRSLACFGWSRTLLVATFILVAVCAICFPSYSRPPPRYEALRRRVEENWAQQGKANTNNERVFIAASLYDPGGKLVSGHWGDAVRKLIHDLGPENVNLSIYENNIDDENKEALAAFEQSLKCNKTIFYEDLDLSTLPHVVTQSGEKRLKRMQFLATVRNRALRPLQDSATHFDKLLYINDVIFDPMDAANLLFSTNADSSGKAQYRAACAVDFENPFKFYDTFATRDAQGYDMGVIFYPWFTGAGDAKSRREVLAQSDAVTVTSCWGGMVAFEAKWFQYSKVDDAQPVEGVELPLRFRAVNDTYWDASECCLIHADLTALSSNPDGETGIFMNPYVRVAYSKSVLDWLWFTRRFERLYTPVQSVVNWIGGRPTFNPRRLEKPGDDVKDKVWQWDADTEAAIQNGTVDSLPHGMHGMFTEVRRKALPGSFCGYRSLSYLHETPTKGGKKWSHEQVPADG